MEESGFRMGVLVGVAMLSIYVFGGSGESGRTGARHTQSLAASSLILLLARA
jgi:hypothetical protein